MTEHLDTTTTFTAVLNTAKEIHDCLTKANHSAYIHWFLKRFYGLITEKSAITKRGLIMAQFGKFIRPGYYRANVEGILRSNVFISAYTGDKLVIVALNIGTSEITQKFIVKNSTKSTAIPYTTSETKNLEAGSTINIIDNNFAYKLPSRSVTTFVIE
jgi:glucuronoarabinoxylan endo-1,4-beta-xylanase